MSILRSKRRKLTADEKEVWDEWQRTGDDDVIEQINPATGNTFREDWWGQGLFAEVDDEGKVKWSPYKQELDKDYERKYGHRNEWRQLTPEEMKYVNRSALVPALTVGCPFVLVGLVLCAIGLLIILRALTEIVGMM